MRVIPRLLFALAAPNIGLAQQAPNQTDLKAAYCIPVVEQKIKVLVSGIENPSVTMSAEDYAKLAKVLDRRARTCTAFNSTLLQGWNNSTRQA